MQLRSKISLTYPDGPEAPPVCKSADVMAEYGLGKLANEYMARSSSQRREGLRGGRGEQKESQPLHLYKYRSLNVNDKKSIDKTRSILVQDRIWIASPASLNDPKDMRFKLVANQDLAQRQQWAKKNDHLLMQLPPAKRLLRQRQLARATITPEMMASLKQDIEQGMGVFCASTDPRSRLLWTHYAAEHRGICIQLAPYEDELFLTAKRVIYSNKFPTLVVPTPTGPREEYYLCKASDWAYEKEWRVVLPLNECSITLRSPAVSAVILGAESAPETVETVLALLQERELLGKPPLKVYQAQLNDESFDISLRRSARMLCYQQA